jgi:hypothetical protein
MRGRYLLGLSIANRQAAAVSTGDEVEVDVEAPQNGYRRPPNSHPCISTCEYRPAVTNGSPASIVSTPARSGISTSIALPTHRAPSWTVAARVR